LKLYCNFVPYPITDKSLWLTSTRDRFKVEDESTIRRGELLAWACIRLDRLRQGYRLISLMDTRGTPITDGKLMVRIEKTVR
jgi:phosphatidylinositol phospholipase C, delta